MQLTPDMALRMHTALAREFWRQDRLREALDSVKESLRAGVPAGDWYDFQRMVEAEWGARQESIIERLEERLMLEWRPSAFGAAGTAIRTGLIEAHRHVTRIIGATWGRPALVTLIPHDSWVEFMHARYGYYAGRTEWHKVCLPPSAYLDGRVFQRATRHELAHAASHDRVGDSIPRWLDEGIAVHAEGGLMSTEAARLNSARSQGKLPTLQQVDGIFESYGAAIGSTESLLAYACAADFTGRLIALHGHSAVRVILRRVAAGEDIGRAFRLATGRALPIEEGAWRRGDA